MIVNLEQDDWNRVLAVLSQAPWNVANPLIMSIGEQLRYQAAAAAGPPLRPNGPDDVAGMGGLGVNQAGKPQ